MEGDGGKARFRDVIRVLVYRMRETVRSGCSGMLNTLS